VKQSGQIGGQHFTVEKIGVFDSPIGTTTNNVACIIGLASATAAGVLIVITWLDGAPTLPPWTFVPCFLLAFPMFVWAFGIVNVLAGRERRREGTPRKPRFLGGYQRIQFADLPKGFLRARDWVVIGAGYVVAFACFRTTRLEQSAPPNRPFLGLAFAFTTFATVVALAEHRRRKSLHLQGVRGWPQPLIPAPRLGRSRGLIAWLLLLGLVLSAVGGTVAAHRLNDYQDGKARLDSDGSSSVTLPGGDDIIFVGYLGESAQPPFDPAQVVVLEVRTGRRIPTRWDPSSDHISPVGIPSLGLISFTTPSDGRYEITIDGPKGLQLFVARSPGAEARLVAGWVALLVVGLAAILLGLVCMLVRIGWRYRVVRVQDRGPPRSVEEWMAQGESP
jgi:hypothetical protein